MRPILLSPDAASAGPEMSIRRAGAEDVEALAGLATQNLLARLAEGPAAAGDHHLVARIGNIAAGLLVSRPNVQQPEVQDLVSLMVTPLFRRRGIGRALLRQLSADMAQAGRKALGAVWSDRLPQLESFHAVLMREGWETPTPWRLRMSFRVGDRVEAMQLAARRIAAAREAGLSSLTLAAAGAEAIPRLLAHAQAVQAAGRLPAWADPAPWLPIGTPTVSQLLVDGHGMIRGWLMAQYQTASGRWLAPIGWCETGPSHMLLAMDAWLAALEETQGPGATVVLHPTLNDGAKVCRLLDRHFRPHALWADHLITSRKAL